VCVCESEELEVGGGHKHNTSLCSKRNALQLYAREKSKMYSVRNRIVSLNLKMNVMHKCN